jgi:tetratricopeptide (TPR) repeat protein
MYALRLTAVLSAAVALSGCGSAEAGRSSSSGGVTPIWTLSTSSEEAREHMMNGHRAWDSGRALQAYEQYKRAVAADSAFAFGYLRVAQTALSLDEYRTNLQRAIAFQQDANAVERLLIDIERKVFDRDQQGALELARTLTEMEPDNFRSWWVLSDRQLAAGEIDGSRTSARRAMELAPEYGATSLWHGNAFVTEPQDLAIAERYVLRGGELWPNEPLSHDLLGDVRRAQNRLPEAEQAYSRQIELDPREADGYQQRGHVHTFLGNFAQARADYDAAIRISKGNAPAIFGVFRAYVSVYAGDVPAAVAELDELIEAIDGLGIPDPDGAKSFALGPQRLMAAHVGDVAATERAQQRLEEIGERVAQRVQTPEFRRGTDASRIFGEGFVGLARRDTGVMRRKAAEFMRVVEPDRDPTKNRRAHQLLGLAAFHERRYDEALQHFEQTDPDNVYVWYHRALALEALGRAEEAQALFRKVAIFNFSTPPYGLVRADAIRKAGG